MTDREAREAFEAWVGKGLCLEQIPTGAPSAGDYRNIVMQTRWDAWQAATAAALERAEKACEEEAADIRSEGKGCHTGQYDHMADGAGRCAQAIRALKEQP